MKILSFKKPLKVVNGEVLVQDELAHNQEYTEINANGRKYLLHECPDGKYFADEEGKFIFAEVKEHQHTVTLVAWKQEYDHERVYKVSHKGTYQFVRTYITTEWQKHELCIFAVVIGDVIINYHKENGKWIRKNGTAAQASKIIKDLYAMIKGEL